MPNFFVQYKKISDVLDNICFSVIRSRSLSHLKPKDRRPCQLQHEFAVVGFGLVGRRHAEVLRRSPGLELAAVVDPQEESRRQAG